MAMARALGSLRATRFGAGALGVKAILFVGNGTLSEPTGPSTWTDYKVAKVTTEISYYPFRQGIARSPGIRWDFERTGADGRVQRQVQAAADDVAWNQTNVTGEAAPVSGEVARDRLRFIGLTPHGLVWAALDGEGKKARDGVQVASQGGQTVLRLTVAGMPVTARLDADSRPEHVEARFTDPVLGATVWEADYSGYQDFERAYFVHFPERIVHKVNGRTVLDLTVTEFHTNPYVVFPLPPGIATRAAK
jgi:hypothetical protein